MTNPSLPALKQSIETELRAQLDRRRPAGLATLHIQSAYAELEAFLLRPGKRVRSLLYLMGVRIFGGAIRQPHMDVAAALEILHAFILIHDDIIDCSDERRGRPTLHRAIARDLPAHPGRLTAGRDLALVAGDLAFAMAQQALVESGLEDSLKLRLLSALLNYTIDTGLGECADIVFGLERIRDISLGSIDAMYTGKTVRYTIEAPLVLAGLTAGIEPDQLAGLASACLPIGLAFQIENDLRKFQETAICDDLAGAKKTTLLRAAWEMLDASGRGELQAALDTFPPTQASLARAAALIQASGALPRLEKQVERLFLRGEALLQQTTLSSAHKAGSAQLFRLLRGLAGGRPEAAFPAGSRSFQRAAHVLSRQP